MQGRSTQKRSIRGPDQNRSQANELEALARLREAEAVAGLGHWVVEPDSGRLEWSDQA